MFLYTNPVAERIPTTVNSYLLIHNNGILIKKGRVPQKAELSPPKTAFNPQAEAVLGGVPKQYDLEKQGK